MTIDPIIKPKYKWKTERKNDKKTVNAKLIEENTLKLKSIDEQWKQILVPGIYWYNHMKIILFIWGLWYFNTGYKLCLKWY